jgi:hypothetical protein
MLSDGRRTIKGTRVFHARHTATSRLKSITDALAQAKTCACTYASPVANSTRQLTASGNWATQAQYT